MQLRACNYVCIGCDVLVAVAVIHCTISESMQEIVMMRGRLAWRHRHPAGVDEKYNCPHNQRSVVQSLPLTLKVESSRSSPSGSGLNSVRGILLVYWLAYLHGSRRVAACLLVCTVCSKTKMKGHIRRQVVVALFARSLQLEMRHLFLNVHDYHYFDFDFRANACAWVILGTRCPVLFQGRRTE